MNIVSIEPMPRVGDADQLLLAFDNGRKQIARVSQVSVLVSADRRRPMAYAVVKAMKEAAAVCGVENVPEWLEAQSDKARKLLDGLQ